MNKLLLGTIALCMSFFSVKAQVNGVEENEKRNFQMSFISPLSTNGMHAHLTTNKVSLNLLGGYSYGNTAFELGGIYNVNTHFTKGLQLAGIMNYSGNTQNAVQVAGIANVAKGGTTPLQIGGIANVAKKVQGVQLAGIANVADKVHGLQLAGIVNVANELHGVQFGLINIAKNSENGTPIGLINIVKEGGKHELEVAFSEAIHTTVSYKLGTDRFYTIFSGGINYINQPVNYAAGLGFGTHVDWKNGWGNQIEVLGYALSEEGTFPEKLNMLTQLKFTVSKDIAKHFKIFAGPVLNMTVSQYTNPETGELGSTMSPWSMWEHTSDKTNINAWVGLSAGVRF